MFDREVGTSGIPKGLDTLQPGPRLAGILSSIDVERLGGRDAVVFARAQHRQIAYDQAREYRALSRVGDLYIADDPDLAEFASAEISAGLTYTRRAADREMGVAFDIVHRYPALLEAMETGTIDTAKVRVILKGVGHVDTDLGNEAIARILPDVPTLTTGQIAARLRKLVIEADPDEAKKAYERGLEEAKVWSCLEPDGTGTMIANGLEAHDLSAANRNINWLARQMKNAGDPRSIDKIRADVFIALLTGEARGTAQKAQCDISASLETLTRLNEEPGELGGYGPVIADIARQVFEQQQAASWTFTITDPATGEVFVGTTRRRPTAQMRREIVARYPTCVDPTCRKAAMQCDLDHTTEWVNGGLTTLCNLAPLCRYHHRMRHRAGWRYRKLSDGTIEWTSRFGLRYAAHPP